MNEASHTGQNLLKGFPRAMTFLENKLLHYRLRIRQYTFSCVNLVLTFQISEPCANPPFQIHYHDISLINEEGDQTLAMYSTILSHISPVSNTNIRTLC